MKKTIMFVLFGMFTVYGSALAEDEMTFGVPCVVVPIGQMPTFFIESMVREKARLAASDGWKVTDISAPSVTPAVTRHIDGRIDGPIAVIESYVCVTLTYHRPIKNQARPDTTEN